MRTMMKVLLIFFLSWIGLHQANSQQLRDRINWREFLSSHDLQFKQIPKRWEEAPYFGNGFIGSMIYSDSTTDNRIKIQVFRTDVHDHRGDSSGWTPYSRPRLIIGDFYVATKGKITGGNMRLNLLTADLTGSIQTTEGSISIHHYVSATHDLITTEFNYAGNEEYTVSWQPFEAKSTRKVLFPETEKDIPKFAEAYGSKYNRLLRVYRPNPNPELREAGDISLSVQNLLAGGQYVVAWKDQKLSGGHCLLNITVQKSYPDKEAENKAIKIITDNAAPKMESRFNEHKTWWANFYAKSFLSIPDKQLEGLYWLQLYKVGSACRANGPIMDTSGPWLQETPWPYITWDLNVQLCYWLLNGSNHLDLAMSLPNALSRNSQQLVQNVKPEAWQSDAAYLALATAQDLKGTADDDQRYENLHSNLPWIMHNVWLIYRFSMDKDFLRQQCYPLLKRSINYYLHLLTLGEDGFYHIPVGYSPEYPVAKLGRAGETKDANIDISLVKWGLQTLIDASEILNLDDEQRTKWRNLLSRIVDFQTDENGLKIGADLPYSVSHRHYSHLLMIYPLYLINVEQEGKRELIERSLCHWIGDPKGLQGYSFTGASSISAAIGDGNGALRYLRGLNRFLQPNGLYKEKGPCFETPLSAAQSIQDMLLQSWGGKIRLFPAVPDEWENVVFHKWLAEGAFEVSAGLSNAKADFVRIKSLAGSPCILVTQMENPEGFIDGKETKLKLLSKNTYEISLKRNQIVLIKRKGADNPLEIGQVSERWRLPDNTHDRK